MELEHVIQLPEDSNDAPTFKSLHPQYDTLIYGDDGVRLTAKERKLLHLYEDDGDVTLLPDPEPAEDIVPHASPLDVPPGDTPNALCRHLRWLPLPPSQWFLFPLALTPCQATILTPPRRCLCRLPTPSLPPRLLPAKTPQDQTHSGQSAPPDPTLACETIEDRSDNPRPGIEAVPSTSARSSQVTTMHLQALPVCVPLTTILRGPLSLARRATGPLPFQ